MCKQGCLLYEVKFVYKMAEINCRHFIQSHEGHSKVTLESRLKSLLRIQITHHSETLCNDDLHVNYSIF